VAVGLGVSVHLMLASGALAGLPAGLRLVLAFAVLVLLPGLALVRLTAPPPGGAWLVAGWALGLGVAWQGLLVLVTRALGFPFTVLAFWSAPGSALLWMLALVRREPLAAPHHFRLPWWAGLGVLAAAALALLYAWRLGPPLSYYTDSPDHLGTIRRMMASGDAFPADAFFRDAGLAGADPRKGLWHPVVALIARLAHVDPVGAWRRLAGLLLALFVLNAAGLGVLLGGAVAAIVGAWALLVTYGGSVAHPALCEAVFATKLADQLALATAVAVLADLEEPHPRRRLAAVGLGLGAIATHLFSVIQFTLTFGALGIGLLVRDLGTGVPRPGSAPAGRPALRRLALTALLLALVSLPYLLWRARQAYAPHNIIHTEMQGLFTLWDGVRVVSPGVLWGWMGPLWWLFPLAWVPLWRRAREGVAPLFLLTTSLGVALVLFDPPAVVLLEPRLGYLLMRLVWLAPLAGLLAWLLPELVRSLARRSGLARLGALAALAFVLWLLAPMVRDALRFLPHPERVAALRGDTSVMRWRSEFDWLERNLEPGRVVLADPATSYAIPMFTRHYVVTLVDQHSSPNDSLALTRLLDARDALDPYARWERTREVVRHYGVEVIVLNARFAEWPRLDYWAPRPEWFAAARARLDAAPTAFEPLMDEGDFVVYRVHAGALDTLSSPPRSRPFVRPFVASRRGAGAGTGAGPPATRLPALVGFGLEPRTAAAGDTLRGAAEWHAAGPLPAGAYLVSVRFDRALPGGVHPPAWFTKPYRKALERRDGQYYRFRDDHLPVGGAYGVDLWRADQVVRDAFELVVPAWAAPGEYVVRVRMIREPHYPNYRLADYFFDEDYYAGEPVGRLRIVQGGGT
jgi:hypothetical protein